MGAATAHLLAERGARAICIADIANKHFAEVTALIKALNPPTEVRCQTVDVSSSESVDR
jgi:NAD(P)-dependent dehydrogenase (short-subunit alcohol dehydrogenase family)